MAVQIDTTTSNYSESSLGSPFYKAGTNKNVFRLSDDSLVVLYCKDSDDIYYAISTDNGATWNEYAIQTGSFTNVTAIQDGDDLIVAIAPSSQTDSKIATLTYNSGTHTYSVGTFYNTFSGPRGGIWVSNLVTFNSQLFHIIGYYISYKAFCSYASSPSSTWTSLNSKNAYSDPGSAVAIIMSDRLRLFAIIGDDLKYCDLTYSGSYSWGSWTTIQANIAIDNNTGLFLTAHYEADDDIYLIYRHVSDGNEYLIHYNGSSWSSAVEVTPSYSISQFFKVNGILYLGYRKHDGSNYTSIVYRTVEGSTLGDEITLATTVNAFAGVAFEDGSSGYVNFFYVDGSGSPYGIYYDSVEASGGLETWSLSETLNVADSYSTNLTAMHFNVDDTLNVADDYSMTPIFPWHDLIGTTVNPACCYCMEATTNVSGLDHLEGQVVAILANGEVLDEQVVTGGQITLEEYYSKVAVGLPYEADLETLKINVDPGNGGTVQGLRMKVGNVTFHLRDTKGGQIGPDEDNLYDAFTVKAINAYSGLNIDEGDLYTGKLRQPLGAQYGYGGHIFIRQRDPLPITIGSVIPEVDIGGLAR